MQARFDPPRAAPDVFEAVLALDAHVMKDSALDRRLLHLIKVRASQINGCAFCLDMHVKEARRSGLGQQRIDLISTWRESPIFDERERAVLGWTEALTNLAQAGVSDADYETLHAFFSESEIMRLSVAIGTINLWNRLCVAARSQHPVDRPA